MATAAVNAAAEDECPEGNEDDVGMSTPRFGLSQTRAGGRRRGKRGLSMPLASALEPASASSPRAARSEEHTSELQSLMRISYAVFCLKKKTIKTDNQIHTTTQ